MAMNIYRLIGDMCRLFGTVWFCKMIWKGNTSGISRKSFELYLIVSVTRYLDLFTTFYSLYNSFMKIAYIGSGAVMVYFLYRVEPACTMYNASQDSLPHWKFLVLPSILLAIVAYFWQNSYDRITMLQEYPLEGSAELAWHFSILLEAVAMLPQLLMVRRNHRLEREHTGGARDEIYGPICLFGLYRLFYMCNWVYRSITERYYKHHKLVYFAAFVQVALYTEFFYICCRSLVVPASTLDPDEAPRDDAAEEDAEAAQNLVEPQDHNIELQDAVAGELSSRDGEKNTKSDAAAVVGQNETEVNDPEPTTIPDDGAAKP